MTQKFLEQFDGNLEDADAIPYLKCMYQQVAVFKKHMSFCLVSKSARDDFPVVGIGAVDGIP